MGYMEFDSGIWLETLIKVKSILSKIKYQASRNQPYAQVLTNRFNIIQHIFSIIFCIVYDGDMHFDIAFQGNCLVLCC